MRVTALVVLSMLAASQAWATGEPSRSTASEPTSPVAQFRDWSKGCDEASGGKAKRCYIFEAVALNDSDQPILKAVIGHLTDDPKQTVLVLTAPLGVYLPAGIGLEGGKYLSQEKHDYLTCDNKGCRAVIEMTDARVKAFRRAPKVKVTIEDGQHRAIEIPLSLHGFSDGLDSL